MSVVEVYQTKFRLARHLCDQGKYERAYDMAAHVYYEAHAVASEYDQEPSRAGMVRQLQDLSINAQLLLDTIEKKERELVKP
jgi:hypothetical protein